MYKKCKENCISQTQFLTGDFLSQYYLKRKIGATHLRRTFSVCETMIFLNIYIYIYIKSYWHIYQSSIVSFPSRFEFAHMSYVDKKIITNNNNRKKMQRKVYKNRITVNCHTGVVFRSEFEHICTHTLFYSYFKDPIKIEQRKILKHSLSAEVEQY